MLAGGTESMSDGADDGPQDAPGLQPGGIFEDENIAIAYGMGITAENVAR
jgi:acetyl-CoA acyltransferase